VSEQPCEYCGAALPQGVDKSTRQIRSRHFQSCDARPKTEWTPLDDYRDTEIKTIKAERDAATTWQPISTAPKDGRSILVWNDIAENCEVVFWNEHWAYQSQEHFGVCCSKWMSLDAAIDAARGK
jgi:hypothetical protein